MTEKPNEDKFYHMNGNSCVGVSDERVESLSGADRVNLTWLEFQEVVNPPKSNDEIELEFAQSENAWVASVMPEVEIQINYHEDNDTDRMTATLDEWKSYRVSLRNYVKDGKVAQPGRPQRPQ